jgi:hypothetical protein
LIEDHTEGPDIDFAADSERDRDRERQRETETERKRETERRVRGEMKSERRESEWSPWWKIVCRTKALWWEIPIGPCALRCQLDRGVSLVFLIQDLAREAESEQ